MPCNPNCSSNPSSPTRYIAFVVDRYSKRVDVCIDTVEAASQVALQSAVLLRGAKRQAARLVRFTHLILHLYYLTIDGPMDEGKWRLCERRRLLTSEEQRELQTLTSPESAVFVWALEVIFAEHLDGRITEDHAVRLEQELSTVKRLASSQKDYHESPIPMPFFHLMSVLSHAYLIVLGWNSANRLVQSMSSVDTCVVGDVGCDDFGYVEQSAGEMVGALAGEMLGTLTMIVAVNTLRRIALAMTNPFGDDETDYELDYDLRRLWSEAEETLVRMREDDDTSLMRIPSPQTSKFGKPPAVAAEAKEETGAWHHHKLQAGFAAAMPRAKATSGAKGRRRLGDVAASPSSSDPMSSGPSKGNSGRRMNSRAAAQTRYGIDQAAAAERWNGRPLHSDGDCMHTAAPERGYGYGRAGRPAVVAQVEDDAEFQHQEYHEDESDHDDQHYGAHANERDHGMFRL